MLTHSPDAEKGATAGGACTGTGEMADRVLCGELLGGLSETRGVAHTVDGSVRWLHRALEGTPLHHALSRYLPDLEAPIGSRFDRYV